MKRQPYGVIIEMYLPEPKGRRGLRRDWRSAPYGEVKGTLQMCGEDGQMRSYTIEGNPDDRQATHLHFYSTPAEKPAPKGLTSNWYNGAWDGSNKLDFTVTFHWEKMAQPYRARTIQIPILTSTRARS